MKDTRLAILDLYDGTPNQGLRCIQDIVKKFQRRIEVEWFDVRGKSEVPKAEDFDIFILSGGPGDPRDTEGDWQDDYYALLDDIYINNQDSYATRKFAFFICHSFQMAINHFGLAKITARKSPMFGTTNVHLTEAGKEDMLFDGLPDPFTAADFRSYQVVEPNTKKLAGMGAQILAMEKIRPYVDLERAVMAVRFSPEMFGVQFHPEADAPGMLRHFRSEEVAVMVLNEHGKDKLETMVRDLSHPQKIELTHKTILPTFINDAINVLKQESVAA